MSNDIAPQTPPTPSALDRFMEKLNLPEVLAGPAGKAISRLVGELADIPSVWINRRVQNVKDGTEARSMVTAAIAKAAAERAASDPEIVARALDTFLGTQIRNQTNKETVAKKTLEYLAEPKPEGNPSGQVEPPPQVPDDDWMNLFEKHVENASSERLQDLWARILAGEIRKSRTFSLQTLRFVAELDVEIASLFERHATKIIGGDFIPSHAYEGRLLMEALKLEEFGLVTGAQGTLTWSNQMPKGLRHLSYPQHLIAIEMETDTHVSFQAMFLTRTGKEIYKILSPVDDVANAKELVAGFPKQSVVSIKYVPMKPTSVDQTVVLFEKSPKSENDKGS